MNEGNKNKLLIENKKLNGRIEKLKKDMNVLSDNLEIKEKEINDLKKNLKDLENNLSNKDKEIEKLKESLNNKEEEGKKNLIENDILKQELKASEETINYLKKQLVMTKKEIIDKEQNILEIKNENIKQIEDLTNKYELKLFEINNYYNFLKGLYDKTKEKNKKLINTIIDKDEENTNLLIEIENITNNLIDQ